MERVKMDAERRHQSGKGPSHRQRAAGRIPAVFYGRKTEPIPLSVDAVQITKAIDQGGRNFLFDLSIHDQGKAVKKRALLKDRQINPLDGKIVHLDFLEVFDDVRIEVNVPVEFVGKPAGVEKGGFLEVNVRSIGVSCLPPDIPESIRVDVSSLDIGQSIHLKDVAMPPDVHLHQDETLNLASIVLPKRAKELAAEAGAEVAEEAPAAEAPAGEASKET